MVWKQTAYNVNKCDIGLMCLKQTEKRHTNNFCQSVQNNDEKEREWKGKQLAIIAKRFALHVNAKTVTLLRAIMLHDLSFVSSQLSRLRFEWNQGFEKYDSRCQKHCN